MKDLKKLLKQFNYFIQYLCVKFVHFMLQTLGYEKASNLGAFLAKNLIKLASRYKLILDNISKSSLKVSKNKKQKIREEVLANFGRLFAEFPFLANWKEGDFKKYVKIIGKENLPKKQNSPIIILTGHFGNWEVLVNQLSFLNKPYAVYRKQNNPYLEKYFQSMREKTPEVTFVEKRMVARKLSEIASSNGTIGMLCDLKEDGMIGKFMGRDAKMGISVAKIALKYGFQIIPVRIDRFDKFYFNIHIFPEVKFKKSDIENKNYENMTLQIYKIYEDWIAQDPGNWYWLHNRWSK